MSKKTRRSWLLAPVSKPDLIAQAARSGADAIVLDLVEFVADADRQAARAAFHAALAEAKSGGAAVYAQVDPAALEADLAACVAPGLSGVVVTRAESAAQIKEIDMLLARFERERGIAPGTVRIVPALETARGNHAGYEIACASSRVEALTLGRADLVMDLRPEPSGEIHLMEYLMQRLIVIAGAARVAPLGAWWRAPDRGLLATADNTFNAARRGRAIGFRGALCIADHQVEPLNRAYG
jgi:citrate lyase subunit beta/citryl-CoA lyase